MTPKDVRDAVFGKASLRSRGYDEFEVDALLERLGEALEDGMVSAQLLGEVRSTRFATAPVGRLGYRRGEVDRILARFLMDTTAGSPPDRKSVSGHGVHELTAPAEAHRRGPADRDAARRGRAAVIRGIEPADGDKPATLRWASALNDSGAQDDPRLAVVSGAAGIVVLTAIIVQAQSGRVTVGWLAAAVLGTLWVAAYVWALRRSHRVERWMQSQQPSELSINDLLDDGEG